VLIARAGVGEATRGLVAAALTESSAATRAVVLDADALISFAGAADDWLR